MHSFLYKLGSLIFCVLVAVSLFGSKPARADEAEPTSQAAASPTAAEVQPTEPVIPEPTMEIVPTGLPTLVVPTQAPPTETFRVIEISTRVATQTPTTAQPPTPIPTLSEPATGSSPTTAPPDITFEPVSTAPVAPPDDQTPTAIIEEPVPVGVINSATPTIPEATYTASVTAIPIVTITPTDVPYWIPGPECNTAPGNDVVRLSVPYIHQVMDIGGANGNWACGPTSVAMILAYYGKLQPWQEYVAQKAASYTPAPIITSRGASTGNSSTLPAQTITPSMTSTPRPTLTSTKAVRAAGSDVLVKPAKLPSGLGFAPYVSQAYTNNGYTYDATALDPSGNSVAGLYGTICPNGLADWSRMAFVLQQHGLSGRHISVTWEGIVAALDRGHPVILGNALTSAGHIIVVIGYTDNGNLIVNDSYGDRFSPGYGGTRGAGLYYPWNCTLPRNAYEVIGTYPPPTGTPGPQASDMMPSLPAGNFAAASRNETPWLVTLMKKNAPPTPQPTPPALPTATRIVAQVTRADMPTRPPVTPTAAALAAATPIIGGWTAEVWAEQQHGIGWGLFSMLSLAAIFVGVSSVRKTRRSNVLSEAAGLAPAVLAPAMLATETTAQPDISTASGAERPGGLAQDGVHSNLAEEGVKALSRPAVRPAPGKSKGVPPILRRGLLLVPSLLLLGLKLYQVSRGQQSGPLR